MRTVVLHIGAMKTGTSYIQSVLWNNRDLLAKRGVLSPGRNWRDQRKATQDLLASRGKAEATTGTWSNLAAEIAHHDGPLAVISMEFLSFAPPEVAERAVAAFAPDEVRVVLTLRDLARVIPAQWQETTQNMRDWPYRQYVSDLMSERPQSSKLGAHFWHRQRWPRILRSWQPWVSADNLVVVTVPPPGAPPSALWERFSQASGFDGSDVELAGFNNDSLGGVSAELMRRVSREAAERGIGDDQYHVLKSQLAKRILVHRRSTEPSIVLPDDARTWAEQISAELVEEVKAIGPVVVGDLDDLLPRWPSNGRAKATTDPAAISDELLLDAAVDGLLGLSARLPDPRSSRATGRESRST